MFRRSLKSYFFILKRFSSISSLPSISSSFKQSSQNNTNIKSIIERLHSLPVKIQTNFFDTNTIKRLNSCSDHFIIDLIKVLNDYEIKENFMNDILRSYEDWNVLSRSKVGEMISLFRNLSFKKEVYIAVISRNPMLSVLTEKQIKSRLTELKNFFTNKHLERILLNSSNLLTDDFDLIHYKFTYLFALMGVNQNEIILSRVFTYPIWHIRQRHLFLCRSGLYDRPNKKGLTKCENPKLYHIMDSCLKDYLRICTKDLFSIQQYETFYDCIKLENFDEELLGLRIGRNMQEKVLKSMKIQRREDYLKKSEIFEKD